MATTDQVDKQVPNPTGKGGFGEHPQDRSDGRWNKNESISYQYNRLLRMTPEALDEYWEEKLEAAERAREHALRMLGRLGVEEGLDG